MGSTSRSGTVITSTTSKLTYRSPSRSKGAVHSSKKPERSATWSSRTFCKCWPSLRWNNLFHSTPSRYATRSARSSIQRRRSTPPTSYAVNTTGTATSPVSRQTPRPKRSWRCAPTSRTRAGRACPSSCGRANQWRKADRSSPSGSRSRSCECFPSTTWRASVTATN